MAEQIVRLSFPAKADYLLLARLALAGLARGVPLGEEALADMKLAVTEACGNVVRHAYGSSDGCVGVVFRVGEEKLEMIVEDRGSGLEVADVARVLENGEGSADLASFEGGMGMAIIRAVVDELDVSDGADGRGTVVRMTKYLAPVLD